MSTTPPAAPPAAAPPADRRVREQARDALAVMAFSGAVSLAFSLALLLVHLGR